MKTGVMVRRLVLWGVIVGLAGCGASLEQLQARAAFDLNCPVDQLQIVPIDQRTQGVRGCGRQAAYVENCASPDRKARTCTWIMNTASDQGGVVAVPPSALPPPPPAPPPPAPATSQNPF
jgi:hypothetical protein